MPKAKKLAFISNPIPIAAIKMPDTAGIGR